jgi:hypothetical protein
MGLSEIRQRFYSLLCDGAGTDYVITANTFHRCSQDRTIETLEITGLERAVKIEFTGKKDFINPQDKWSGYQLTKREMLVKIGYIFTGLGQYPTTDASNDMTGEASKETIEERSRDDTLRIEANLGCFTNHGSLNPHVIDCEPIGQDPIEWFEDRAVVTVKFQLTLRESMSLF